MTSYEWKIVAFRFYCQKKDNLTRGRRSRSRGRSWSN